MHDFLKKKKRRHIKEIPLAPILDLLVVVIFFLILSASFIEVRQNTLPPSSTSVVKDVVLTVDLIPLNPKLIMIHKNGEITLLLKWGGEKPGQIIKKLKSKKQSYDFELKKAVTEIMIDFKKNNPKEKSIQLGWQRDINYQAVLTVVDGAMVVTKDLVFLSPEESEILFEKSI